MSPELKRDVAEFLHEQRKKGMTWPDAAEASNLEYPDEKKFRSGDAAQVHHKRHFDSAAAKKKKASEKIAAGHVAARKERQEAGQPFSGIAIWGLDRTYYLPDGPLFAGPFDCYTKIPPMPGLHCVYSRASSADLAAEVICMFERLTAREHATDVADILTDAGWTTTMGNRFTGGAVLKLARNFKFKGVQTAGTRCRGDHSRMTDDGFVQPVRSDDDPPVPEALFDACQRVLDQHPKRPRTGDWIGILTRRIHCEICSAPMSPHSNLVREGSFSKKPRHTYDCGCRKYGQKHPPDAVPSASVNADAIEQTVLKKVQAAGWLRAIKLNHCGRDREVLADKLASVVSDVRVHIRRFPGNEGHKKTFISGTIALSTGAEIKFGDEDVHHDRPLWQAVRFMREHANQATVGQIKTALKYRWHATARKVLRDGVLADEMKAHPVKYGQRTDPSADTFVLTSGYIKEMPVPCQIAGDRVSTYGRKSVSRADVIRLVDVMRSDPQLQTIKAFAKSLGCSTDLAQMICAIGRKHFWIITHATDMQRGGSCFTLNPAVAMSSEQFQTF